MKPASAREQMSCRRARVAASAAPMPLAITQGCAASNAWLMRSAWAMISRTARLYSRASKAARIDSACCANSAASASVSPSYASSPSKWRVMKAAARLAMLTYLPTRSLLTRATKSSGLKSMSSTRAFSLAAM
ncbi:Uncharacterised protein [Bordetella pertussis]|nr:Uncharacterised protein [Bordetella pertussis]